MARRLTRVYEAELRHAGMNPAQFELLATVQAKAGSSQTELATIMDVDQTTLSRNLKLVLANGWLTTSVSNTDKRRVEYDLSFEGRTTLEAAMPYWLKATKRVQAALANRAETVWENLDKLAAVE